MTPICQAFTMLNKEAKLTDDLLYKTMQEQTNQQKAEAMG